MTTPEQIQHRAHVEETRIVLMELHKVLIDQSRADYEKIHAEIANPWNFLQLLMGDSFFSWLHPFSKLITSIDELLEIKLPMREVDATAVRALIENLVGDFPTTPMDFRTHYLDMIQREPNVVVAHAKLKQTMTKLPQPELNKLPTLLKIPTQWSAANKLSRARESGNS